MASEHRSQNEIAYDIVQAAPQVESLVNEWFAALSAASANRREFFCRFCLRPAPKEWGADTLCPNHPHTDGPRYLQTCEYEIGGGPLPEGVAMPTEIIGNVPTADDQST